MSTSISYLVTVNDEIDEIKRLLSFLLENKDAEDEIVILQDWSTVVDSKNSQKNTIASISVTIQEENSSVKYINCPLNKNFTEFKNYGKKKCTKDYIFQIDADELPHKYLIKHIKSVLEANKNTDLLFVPRVNIVKDITEEWLIKWNWRYDYINNVDEKVINFPDYQSRIFKNSPNIKWQGAVHERIIGHENQAFLPEENYWCLYHIKTLEKQIKQNELYSTIKR